MESIWTQSCEIQKRPSLPGDTETEIAVIGAGMAGVLIASALQSAGHQVLVLEAGRIAGGQTCNTTAKITSQHALIYDRLIKMHGWDKALQYATANEAALEAYRRMIAAQGIDCDFTTCDAYVYGARAAPLQAETAAAAVLGLPVSFVRETPLPFPTAGAVRFARQAQFHPLKFIRAVAGPLTIYENTRVQSVQGEVLITDHGRVRAGKIIFACHFPFVNFPGLYFARMHQERSYVLALENVPQIDGMWIGASPGSCSLRSCSGLLLLGGSGHRCGQNRAGGRYAALRQQAKTWFPESRERAFWSAQDCMPADGVPYIGPYARSRPNWYVATGFQKWGMSSSMVAALLLRDLIEGKENPYAPVFDPRRLGWESAAGVAAESAQAVKGLTKELFQIPDEAAKALAPGHGGIVFLNGKKLGVYRDEQGRLWPVDIRCPHLGCQLEWNPDERSWDCPCHGSRFSYTGQLICGPAQKDISRRPK